MNNNEVMMDEFAPLNKEEFFNKDKEEHKESLSYGKDVMRRLKQNYFAIFGIIVIIFLILVAVFGPMVSPYTYSDQDLSMTSIPPRLEITQVTDDTFVYVHPTLKVYIVSTDGELLGTVNPKKVDRDAKTGYFLVDDTEIAINFAEENNYKVYDSEGNLIESYGKVWNKKYLFGTDHLGRDILIRVIYGARISLIIGFVASIVNLTVGVLYGGIAGYAGGVVDDIMMRIIDILRSIPRLLYVIIIMVVVGSGLKTVMLTIGLVFWLGMARIVRAQVLSLRSREFVMAAKTMGASTWRILIKHLIPNAFGPIIIVTTMNIPGAIFTEAFLSFVGLGVSAPQASWGTLCNDALSGFQIYPYQLFFPAAAICLTVLAFNFLGDGLRDSLDPRLRK